MKKILTTLTALFFVTCTFSQPKPTFTNVAPKSLVVKLNQTLDTLTVCSDTLKVIKKGDKILKLDSSFTIHINDAILLGNLLIKTQELISKTDVPMKDGVQLINLFNLFIDEIKKQAK
jgi:hypothetical protein